MKQTYKGVPVIGGELIVHMTKDQVTGINGRFVADLDVDTRPAITSDQAAAEGLSFIEKEGGINASVVETRGPVIFVNEENIGRLAIPVRVKYDGPNGPEIDDFFIDAETKLILGRHPLVHRARYRQIYNANHDTLLPGTFMFGEEGPTLEQSNDQAAVGAYNRLGTTYNFYSNVFGRDSYNNAGAIITASVHYGINVNNAMWTGSQIWFGDGDGRTSGIWTGDLDLVAHELTHGVTQSTANLTYSNESGALNEATSDILGECAAFWAGQGGDWLIAPTIWTPGTAGDALRYMYNPTLDGYSADYYPERIYQENCFPSNTNDNCGVHGNSGIANLFFYLLSQGGTHPRNKTKVTVTGIGITKARSIWYRALTIYMTPSTAFQQARAATAQAAADLYGGTCTSEWISVQRAWDAVGVPGNWLCVNPPAAPSGLTATAVSTSQINLTWNDNSANESGFSVERKISTDGTYTQIATVGPNVTSYSDTGVSASTTYCYRVLACNSAGCSPPSIGACATTNDLSDKCQHLRNSKNVKS